MILQALCEYYDRMVRENPTEIAEPGYAVTPVSKCIVIDQEGNLMQVIDRMEEREITVKKGKKEIKLFPQRVITPQQPKRSGSRPQPAFLCENANFIFGIYSDPTGAKYRFEASGALHEEILGHVDDDGARAVVAFFRKRKPGSIDYGTVDTSGLNNGGNLVFMLLGESNYIHHRPKIKEAWDAYRLSKQEDASFGQCLVTGETGPIARIHGNLDGFGQDKPTLVGFNQDSFVSYRKEKGENAPVSEIAAFKYVTALNMLIGDRSHSRNVHGEKMLFWAEKSLPVEENAVAILMGGGISEQEILRDEVTSRRLASVIEHLYKGTRPEKLDLAVNTRMFVLSISANKTRVVIRHFYVDTVGRIIERLQQHHADIYVEGPEWEPEHPSLSKILIETAVRRESKNVPAPYSASLTRSIVSNTPYPNSLFMAMLGRIRAEAGADAQAAINRTRIGVIKGCLNRSARKSGEKEWIGVNLKDTQESQSHTLAYTLGRVFAILNQAQYEALSKVNASIVDKYLNAALASPRQVFPSLLANAQNHFNKLAKAKRYYTHQLLREVMLGIPPTAFPHTLNAEGQGQFMVGFYHQQQAFFKRRDKGTEEPPLDDVEQEKPEQQIKV
ncbi:MAG: type I-C CRISPR-associated protein Cas8c/Csd1 [Paenibacillus macerans]|uniref:type I-C CRISPR-associated protein Cas8c/Csd1 n=1 Tax=Paenibacillus TaxID=44249 RepID=UPI001F11753F|nr:type I-C CRISPR-associated protein Cas8c/Csd1 [Paenibacillus macerans]MDU7474718.1 type I-C CRISPR-associated protein Cas8c/Csd1 [Paenibacillus macerans]UMV49133.1 type I-C CRISPR-associated protein Cas8c/Csd1 [Paenibacillus macerans]